MATKFVEIEDSAYKELAQVLGMSIGPDTLKKLPDAVFIKLVSDVMAMLAESYEEGYNLGRYIRADVKTRVKGELH